MCSLVASTPATCFAVVVSTIDEISDCGFGNSCVCVSRGVFVSVGAEVIRPFTNIVMRFFSDVTPRFWVSLRARPLAN